MPAKKISALCALCCAAAFASAHDGDFSADSIENPSADYLSASASVSYESEYVFRAQKRASFSVRPSLDLSYQVLGFDAYAGLLMNQPLKGQLNSRGELANLQELDAYAGLLYGYGPVTLDVGYIYYWYCGETPNRSRDSEIFVGASLDLATFLDGLNITPSLYYYYDFELLRNTIEASISYEYNLDDILPIEGFSLPLRLYYGYTSAERANGDQACGQPKLHSSYMYFGGSIDLAYRVCDYSSVRIGLRYSQAFNGSGTDPNYSTSQRNIWYGVSFKVGF